MGVFKNKRGTVETSFSVIIELVLIAFILAGVGIHLYNVVSGISFEKQYYAKDVSDIVNSIDSSPGNIFFSYDENRGFVYSIGGNKISVYGQDESTQLPANTYWFFAQDLNLKYAYPSTAVFPEPTKGRTNLTFKKTFDFEFNPSDSTIGFYTCPLIDTSSDASVVVIDPVQDASNPGEKIGDSYEYKYTLDMANYLKGILAQNSVLTRAGDEATDRQQVVNSNPGAIVISLNILGTGDNTVRINSVSTTKSRKLACLLANDLMSGGFDPQIVAANKNGVLANNVSLSLDVFDANKLREIDAQIKLAMDKYFQK